MSRPRGGFCHFTAAALTGGSSGKSSSKAEKIYDGMTDSDLTAKIRSMLAKLPIAQVARVLQGGASGLTSTQAKRALTLLGGM